MENRHPLSPFARILVISILTITAGFLQSCNTLESGTPVLVGADSPLVIYSGRSKGMGTDVVSFGYSGARVRLRFEGSSIGMRMDDDTGENYAMTWIDGMLGEKFRLNSENGYYLLADGLSDGPHTIEVVRVTECHLGLNHFRGFELGVGSKALKWKDTVDRKIEFIGDSITCGYGVEVDDPNLHFEPATENFSLGYSALAARSLKADYLAVSRSGIGMLRNYDGPKEGNVDNMPNVYPHTFYLRPDDGWDHSLFIPDVVCVNLGTNDFSTTGVNVDKYVSSYVEFGSMLMERYPKTQLVLLQGPMNNSDELGEALAKVVDALKKVESSRIHFLELSPQGSVGLGADWHPNRAQSRINGVELVEFLSELMDWQ